MIGIVIPPDVRAKAGIPPGAALGLAGYWPMQEGTHRGLFVGELGDDPVLGWAIKDVLPEEMNAWIEAAK